MRHKYVRNKEQICQNYKEDQFLENGCQNFTKCKFVRLGFVKR